MALALQRHIRSPVDPDPFGTIRRLMDHREENFLGLVQGALSDPASPYKALFEAAGCAYADVADSVLRRGLEPTLEALMREGVYVTHDEFRGRAPIIRNGRHIPTTAASWVNRQMRGDVVTSSGGSSGRSITTNENSTSFRHMEATVLLMVHELDLFHRSIVNVGAVLPAFALLANVVANRLKIPCEAWFALGGATRSNLHYRILTRCMVAQMRAFGARIPWPVPLPPNDFRPVAEYLARRRNEGARTAVVGYVSAISRIAAAVVECGLDVAGCLGIVAAESLTEAKRRVIESAGIEPYSTYGASECGMIGYPCRNLRTGNRVHVMRHAIALTTRAREATWADHAAPSLHVTTLLPFTPRLFVNVDIGDTGVVEPIRCDCLLSELGFDLQVSEIAAAGKLTAQGVTVAADDLVRLLEESLPARFGGHSGDYQLIETEGNAQTSLVLRVCPGVCAAPPGEVLDYFLSQAGHLYGGSLSVRLWTHSGGIRAELAPVILGPTGKFRALRLLGPGEPPSDALSHQH